MRKILTNEERRAKELLAERKKISEWIYDDRVIEDAKAYHFFEDELLIQVYSDYPENEKGMLGLDGTVNGFLEDNKKTYPFAKVLAIGDKVERKLAVGQIVTIADDMLVKIVNPKYIEWEAARKDTAKTYIGVNGKQPKRLLNATLDLKWNRLKFFLNKLGEQELHQKDIYCLPSPMIKSRINDPQKLIGQP